MMNYPKRLLALFIGIDKFKYVTDLGGCVKDIRKVMKYFEEYLPQGMEMEIRTLFDEEATKEGIVSAFQEFFIDQANENDLALMYFSGHGAQEKGDEVWREMEADLGLEGLVCHDTGFQPESASLLIDKELRYLIAKLAATGCDILTCFDACHSGDATRNTHGLTARRLTNALPKRKWEDFIFSHEIAREDVASQGWNQLVPEGRHIQLAACEDRELAYENAHGGVFSHNLIEVLKDTQGQVSYFDLQSKIKYAIKGGEGDVNQTPQAHAAYGYEQEVFRLFLSKNRLSAPNYGNLSYNAARNRWIFDKGEIHGIKPSSEEEDSLLAIPVKGDRMTYARITEVMAGYSFVDFINPEALDSKRTYTGFAKGLLSTQLKFTAAGDTRSREAVEDFYETHKEPLRGVNLQWVKEENLADYVIRGVEVKKEDGGLDNYLVLTHPEDDRPLSRQVRGQSSEDALEDIFSDLKELVRFEFLKKLKNNRAQALPDNALQFSISPEGMAVHDNKAEVILEGKPSDRKDPLTGKAIPVGPDLKVSIKNNYAETLYVACLYMGGYDHGGMSYDFAIKPGILQPQVVILEPGATAFLNGGASMQFAMNPHIWQFSWPYQEVAFKLIASLESFDVQPFDQNGIKVPVYPWPDRSGTRALAFNQKKSADPKGHWQAWNYKVKVSNPYFEG